MKRKSTSAASEFVGVAEAAGLLGLYPTVVRYHAKQGNLTAMKVGRDWVFRRADVLAFSPRKAGRPRKDKSA